MPCVDVLRKEGTRMKNRAVTISAFDYRRLQELLLVARQFASPQPSFLRDLEGELQRASVVPPEQIPP